MSTNTIVPIPQFCFDHALDGIWALRTQACEIQNWVYRVFATVNGETIQVGELDFLVNNLQYSDTGLPTWGHQFEVTPYLGSGAALEARFDASATSTGNCITNSSTFEAGNVQVDHTFEGEAFFDTTITAIGAIGTCTTTWTLLITNPGISTPSSAQFEYSDIRCDNATVGRENIVGCVVPWYAPELTYSQTNTPDLARHVTEAQASGLPGATFANPLTRTTDGALRDANRAAACGDAPSITGLSCDEYPFATTRNGIANDPNRTRRTFDGCSLSLPRMTGPNGVSVCMIPVSDQNSQGGTNNAFFRGERVIDGDEFRVAITP